MSFIAATKELLGDDLNKLISHVTHLKRGTPEYKQFEDFAWRQILGKYHTSVTDDNVKTCIDGFAEKFIFHGFAQKAENLRLLIRYYSNLDYFKNKTDGTLKWGFILFLIRLSHRPTDCLEDDDPLDIRALLKPENTEEPIKNWPAYLKEGWEKFRLPSDDESVEFSDDEVPRNDFDLNDIPIFRENAHRPGFPGKNVVPPQPQLTIAECDKLCQDTCNEVQIWVESHYRTPWWKMADYSEKPSAKNLSTDYCYVWKAQFKDRDKESEMRVIRETKIIMELLYVLGTVNGSSSYLFDCHAGTYSLKNNLSIPSLSPPMFQSVMESHFCKYLPYIASLVQFTEKMSRIPVLDGRISDTYVAYSKAIGDILNDFRFELSQAEVDWSKRESVVTLRTTFCRLQPWFDCLEFLSSVHSRAVYPDFTQVETWRSSLRLLGVILNEMKWISNSKFKKLALGLFLNVIRIYLRIIARMIKGIKNADPKKEFLIFGFGENQVLQIHRYSSLLMENNISADEFWGPLVTSCYRAISSTHFILQLNKRSTFSKTQTDTDVLIRDVIEELKKCLSPVAEIIEKEEPVVLISPICETIADSGIREPLYTRKPETIGSNLVRAMFRDSFKPKPSIITQDTPVDKFMKSLDESKLTTYPVNFFITQIFVSVIKKYMEPVGFAFDTLINEFKLLAHLKCLRRVFFIQILEQFVRTLFREIANKSLVSLNWTNSLRNCISDYYDNKTAHQYRCTVAQVSLISSTHPKFVHESLSFTKLYYEPEAHLKVLIPDSCIKAYNEIFKFLLQIKWAYHIIANEFILKGVVETPDNFSLFRRMYLLRLRLLNSMTAFRNYFFSMDESGFEDQIKDLCVKARDLQTIARAHKDFLVRCKLHCFLNRKNECKLLVDALLIMCFKCVKLWASRGELTASDVNALEEEYYKLSSNLVAALHKRESDYSGSMKSHYSLLQNDLTAYLPPAPCSRSASAELSSAHNFSTFSQFNQSVKFSSSGFKDA